jgi:hypothetical protein
MFALLISLSVFAAKFLPASALILWGATEGLAPMRLLAFSQARAIIKARASRMLNDVALQNGEDLVLFDAVAEINGRLIAYSFDPTAGMINPSEGYWSVDGIKGERRIANPVAVGRIAAAFAQSVCGFAVTSCVVLTGDPRFYDPRPDQPGVARGPFVPIGALLMKDMTRSMAAPTGEKPSSRLDGAWATLVEKSVRGRRPPRPMSQGQSKREADRRLFAILKIAGGVVWLLAGLYLGIVGLGL